MPGIMLLHAMYNIWIGHKLLILLYMLDICTFILLFVLHIQNKLFHVVLPFMAPLLV